MSPVFSKKLCITHWRYQYGKNIKKVSEKQKVKKEQKKVLLSEDEEFYKNVWKNKTPHICFECEEFLGYVPYNWMFDHILEKSKYPEFRHNEQNICYKCLECHDKRHRGLVSDKMKQLILTTKEKFNEK